MSHPQSPETRANVIASSSGYVDDCVARLGIDRALPILNRAADIWDDVGEPELAEAMRRAIKMAILQNIAEAA